MQFWPDTGNSTSPDYQVREVGNFSAGCRKGPGFSILDGE